MSRPLKRILLWSAPGRDAEILAYTLEISLHVIVEHEHRAYAFKAALRRRVYDLVILLDAKRLPSFVAMVPLSTPVLATTVNRSTSNVMLFDDVRMLLARKRGPVTPSRAVQVYKEAV